MAFWFFANLNTVGVQEEFNHAWNSCHLTSKCCFTKGLIRKMNHVDSFSSYSIVKPKLRNHSQNKLIRDFNYMYVVTTTP